MLLETKPLHLGLKARVSVASSSLMLLHVRAVALQRDKIFLLVNQEGTELSQKSSIF